MLKSDFYYDLPEELIAQTPLEPRDSSRLMKIDRNSGEIVHDRFYNICDYLKKGGGKVTIEYMPAYDEARFKYSCPTPLFEQSTAMLAIKECIESFVRERGYYFYTYLKPDDTYYDGGANTVIYTSYIKLLN